MLPDRRAVNQNIARSGVVQPAAPQGSREHRHPPRIVGDWGTHLMSKDTLVDFPDPLGPTSATTSPGLAVKDTCFSTCTSGLDGYEKHTSCNGPAHSDTVA